MSIEPTRARAYFLAVFSSLALIALGVAWELWLAPLRPGGSWLVLKVLPLLLVFPGLLKKRLRTYQATSLLLWIYFAEGATRVSSDPSALSQILAGIEVALCLILFWAVAAYAKSYKQPKPGNSNSAGKEPRDA